VFEGNRLGFKEIIDLLDCAPQMCTLEFRSMPWLIENYFSIAQSEKFRRVSETNMVTHIIYKGESTLDKVKLLVALCPRIRHLSIYLEQTTEESVIRLLLDRTNPNTCHLCSLGIRRCATFFLDKLNHLLKSESLLNDYTLKLIDSELYLWW
jgi:hypothetical protein